jgi:hypothetical protein
LRLHEFDQQGRAFHENDGRAVRFRTLGSPEGFPRESTAKAVITQRILDKKSGLATGQPEI